MLRGRSVFINLAGFYHDDKRSMLATLERNWKFVINGQIGTIGQLRKNPNVANEASELFAITQTSILRANEPIGIAEHPKTKRQFPVLEFRCNIRPSDPFPNVFSKSTWLLLLNLLGRPQSNQENDSAQINFEFAQLHLISLFENTWRQLKEPEDCYCFLVLLRRQA